MAKLDREAVLSRRRALLIMAVAGGGMHCKRSVKVAPHVCLEMPRQCPEVRFIAFSGPATELDAHAIDKLGRQATVIRDRGWTVPLRVAVFDDGHANDAAALHEPRIVAVEQKLVELGVAAERIPRAPGGPAVLSAQAWQDLTGDPAPLSLSGLVELVC